MLRHIGVSAAVAVCIPIACQVFYQERPDAACELLSIRTAWLISVLGFFFAFIAPYLIHSVWYAFYATPQDKYMNADDLDTNKPSEARQLLNKLRSLYIYSLMVCNGSVALLLIFGIPFLSKFVDNETCARHVQKLRFGVPLG